MEDRPGKLSTFLPLAGAIGGFGFVVVAREMAGCAHCLSRLLFCRIALSGLEASSMSISFALLCQRSFSYLARWDHWPWPQPASPRLAGALQKNAIVLGDLLLISEILAASSELLHRRR